MVDKEQKRLEAEAEKQALKKMSNTEGAGYLKRFCEGQIAAATTTLTTHQFTDLSEVARQQERIKALRDVLHYIEK